jgi:AraC-like DNA-binding protein
MADALSDVLRSIRLRGGVFLDTQLTAPWAVNSCLTVADCAPFLARPAQLIGYHFMMEGKALFSVDGDPPLEVRAGEIVLVPRNDMHTASNRLGLKAVDGHELVQPAIDGGLARIRHGGGGERVHMLCGFLGREDHLYNPLIASLPRLLKIDVRKATSRHLIESSMQFAVDELVEGRAPASTVLSRLSELLLIEAVRHYANSMNEQESGWLKGLTDPNIGRALALIHQNVGENWTAETLAKEVAMSRSSFTERFTALVGVPPIRYLTSWRMQTAKTELRESPKSIAQIAYAVGYESEEAFSRAFKKTIGMPPSAWRLGKRPAGSTASAA